MQLVDQETFLKRLGELFASKQTKGSIWLTHKRLAIDGENAGDVSVEDDSSEYPILVRATDGDKVGFSTRIEPGQLLSFHTAYGALLKNTMPGALRKRDKKREKVRSEQAAQRKKRIQTDVIVSGSKRGKGRRKRQRQIKAALKQQESREKFKKREEQKNAKATSISS